MQVAAWRDEDGDAYETGLHIFFVSAAPCLVLICMAAEHCWTLPFSFACPRTGS